MRSRSSEAEKPRWRGLAFAVGSAVCGCSSGQLGQRGVDIRFQLRLIKELELMEFLAAGGKALDPAQTQQLFE